MEEYLRKKDVDSLIKAYFKTKIEDGENELDPGDTGVDLLRLLDIVVKHKYQWEDEWQYDVDMGYLGIDDGEIDHLWNTYNDWAGEEECHVTHWMPLPEPPMMKGGSE